MNVIFVSYLVQVCNLPLACYPDVFRLAEECLLVWRYRLWPSARPAQCHSRLRAHPQPLQTQQRRGATGVLRLPGGRRLSTVSGFGGQAVECAVPLPFYLR